MGQLSISVPYEGLSWWNSDRICALKTCLGQWQTQLLLPYICNSERRSSSFWTHSLSSDSFSSTCIWPYSNPLNLKKRKRRKGRTNPCSCPKSFCTNYPIWPFINARLFKKTYFPSCLHYHRSHLLLLVSLLTLPVHWNRSLLVTHVIAHLLHGT